MKDMKGLNKEEMELVVGGEKILVQGRFVHAIDDRLAHCELAF